MKRALLLCACIFVAVSSVVADDYTEATLQERLSQASDQNQATDICREFMINADDLDVVRMAQSRWENVDAESVRSFSARLMNEHPESAKYTYLYGRVAETPVEQIKIGRKTIELDPDFPYGYRLVTAVYINSLFEGSPDDEHYLQLKSMFHQDQDLFKKLAELDSGKSYAHGFLQQFLMYKARLLAERDQFAEAKQRVAEATEAAIRAGGIDPSQKEMRMAEMYIGVLRETENFDQAITFLSGQPGADTIPMAQFELARLNARADKRQAALAHLKKAARVGWDKVGQTRRDEELKPLHDSEEWSTVLASIQTNWDANKPKRRKEALSQKISEEAPGWTLKDAEGNPVSLSNLEGNVVILDFWATWCGPCRMAMPEIDEFTRSLNTEKVKVFSVNVYERGAGDPVEYMNKHDYAMTLLHGTNEMAEDYDIQGIPRIIAIDQDGVIRFQQVGYEEGLGEKLGFWAEDLLGTPVTEVSSTD